MKRISKSDVEMKGEDVNDLLKELGSKLRLKVGHRYGYTAIDLLKDDRVYDTLIAGLRTGEAYDVLYSIKRILTELLYEVKK